MRLQPIERPKGLKMKLVYWMCRRELGKVITPLSVVYARVPNIMKAGYAVSNYVRSGVTLDRELAFILQTHTAQINDCAFCVDIARSFALRGRLGVDRVKELHRFEESKLFTDAEKAALRYVEEATTKRKVSDETFNELKKYYSESEICEITLLNAIENYFNMINIPLEIESDGLCALAGFPEEQAALDANPTGRAAAQGR